MNKILDLGPGGMEAWRAAVGLPPMPFSAFTFPADMRVHCKKIFDGEYDIASLEFATPPRVLDIGANVGAFSVWASERWPGCTVRCYEPNPAAFEYLTKNVPTDVDGALQRLAVRDIPAGTTSTQLLRFGKNNLGEASFNDLGEQRADGVLVEVMSARDLPECDVLKIDVEGDEVAILRGFFATHVHCPAAVLLEFHSEADRRTIDDLFSLWGYALVKARIDHPDRGVMCFVRTA